MVFGKRNRVPDPAKTRARRDRQNTTAQRRIQVLVEKRVLPLINRALSSDDFRSRKAGRISVNGTVNGVSIYEVSGSTGWVSPLLAALRSPDYRAYAVRAVVQWRDRSDGDAKRTIALREGEDPFDAVLRARELLKDRGTLVYVRITVQPR